MLALQTLYLQLALKRMPMQSRKDKPVSLLLPHPLLSPEGADICLFVKDHQGEGHKEAKRMVQRFERKGGVSKVLGLSKLRTKFESHEAKRELCKHYDLFLADERVLPSLPKLIGKSFFKKKKQPIPVDITVKDFPAQVGSLHEIISSCWILQNMQRVQQKHARLPAPFLYGV